jgi:hypothetical protein
MTVRADLAAPAKNRRRIGRTNNLQRNAAGWLAIRQAPIIGPRPSTFQRAWKVGTLMLTLQRLDPAMNPAEEGLSARIIGGCGDGGNPPALRSSGLMNA